MGLPDLLLLLLLDFLVDLVDPVLPLGVGEGGSREGRHTEHVVGEHRDVEERVQQHVVGDHRDVEERAQQHVATAPKLH